MITPTVSGEAARREINASLGRAQAILKLMDSALHKGVELHESEWLFESVERELDQIGGLVRGDLVVNNCGEVVTHR